jgi:hypothetical protein
MTIRRKSLKKPEFKYPTMRESILALCKMSWGGNGVFFTPPEQVSSLSPTGVWHMWEYEGAVTITPLHYSSLINAQGNQILYYCYEEFICIDNDDGMTGLMPFVANNPFHVSIEAPYRDIHEKQCNLFSGGECNCTDDDYRSDEEDE